MIISSNIQPQEWRLINMSMTELEQHYNKFNEEKRLDSRHGQVEYITSMKYIHKYLDKLKEESESDEKPIRILDIGLVQEDTAYRLPMRDMMCQQLSL